MPKTGSVPRQGVYTTMPQETHRNLKAKCALEGHSIGFVIAKLAQAYIDGKVSISVAVEQK